MPDKGKNVYGEGNYEASRQYNDATKKFVESGKVDEAARKAAPTSAREATEMKEAEAKGRAPAKEEDPALHDKTKGTRVPPRSTQR